MLRSRRAAASVPCRRDLAHEDVAGRDETFLVGERDAACPGRTAASVGLSPAAPTIAAITQSAGRLAASISASAPAAASMPVPASRVAQLGIAGLVGDDRELGAMLHAQARRGARRCACRSAPRPRSAAGSRPTRSSVLSPIEPVAPSTEMRRGRVLAMSSLTVRECTRRARSYATPHQISSPRPGLAGSRKAINAAAIAAMRRPSIRSSNPPWPGMRLLMSLAPNRRFTALSPRSPI